MVCLNTDKPTSCQVLMPYKKQVIGSECRIMDNLSRNKATKKKKKNCVIYIVLIVLIENDISTPQNFCISTPQVI